MKYRKTKPGINGLDVYIIVFLIFLTLGINDGFCQGWSERKTRALPDNAFAVIEKDVDGKKLRHCPHHDKNGDLDIEQLIYVLGTFDSEVWFDQDSRMATRTHLNKHYEKVHKKILKNMKEEPINIDTAGLAELVSLPHIGPVLAVRIVEYRNNHSLFRTIDEIKKVEGIGQVTFNAIRYYITITE